MSRQPLLDELQAVLQVRQDAGLLRTPQERRGTSFTSNDYLGLAHDRELSARVARGVEEQGIGLTGSRLLSGHGALPKVAESALAGFCGQPSATLFSSGYAANVGLISAVAGPGDHIISDRLNHASLIDGMRLSGANKHIFAHADLDALEAKLRRLPQTGRRVVVVESVYSMDGDLAPLGRICDVAERYGAAVIVDEAHATGLYGARGSGRVEACGVTERVLCTVHTGGKALGSGGAWVAAPLTLTRYLHNFARTFVYSTAPPPAVILSLVEAVRMLPKLAERVASVHRKSALLRSELQRAGFNTGASQGCIVPVIIGDAVEATRVSELLQREGFDIRAIRPPTVPEGTSRLRLTVTANIAEPELFRLLDVLVQTRAVA